MSQCRWTYRVARWFDTGAGEDHVEVREHLSTCPQCTAYLHQLESLREAVRPQSAPSEISDAQFSAFMRGIQEGLKPPARRFRGLWTWISVAAMFLIVLGGLSTMRTGPAAPVVVESCTSELDGATVTTYSDDNGETTIWIDAAEDDVS